jgi:chromosome segregation ATPase
MSTHAPSVDRGEDLLHAATKTITLQQIRISELTVEGQLIQKEFQDKLQTAKENISNYVRDKFLQKHASEIERAKEHIQKLKEELELAHEEARMIADERERVQMKLDKMKEYQHTAVQQVEKLRVTVDQLGAEQMDIRHENQRLLDERNTFALENKKLRNEKNVLARELDIHLYRMSQLKKAQDSTLSPKQAQKIQEKELQVLKKKLFGNEGRVDKTEREKELEIDLGLFVSRSEQIKPTVNALKESSQELRKYMNAFLDNVVTLILRDAQIQPFVNDQYLDVDTLLDEILELDDEYEPEGFAEASVQTNQDAIDSLVENYKSSRSVPTTDTTQKKKALYKRQAVLERMRQREVYLNAVENMRDYIEKRLSKNDSWWTRLQRDWDKLLIQPSLNESQVSQPSEAWQEEKKEYENVSALDETNHLENQNHLMNTYESLMNGTPTILNSALLRQNSPKGLSMMHTPSPKRNQKYHLSVGASSPDLLTSLEQHHQSSPDLSISPAALSSFQREKATQFYKRSNSGLSQSAKKSIPSSGYGQKKKTPSKNLPAKGSFSFQ